MARFVFESGTGGFFVQHRKESLNWAYMHFEQQFIDSYLVSFDSLDTARDKCAPFGYAQGKQDRSRILRLRSGQVSYCGIYEEPRLHHWLNLRDFAQISAFSDAPFGCKCLYGRDLKKFSKLPIFGFTPLRAFARLNLPVSNPKSKDSLFEIYYLRFKI